MCVYVVCIQYIYMCLKDAIFLASHLLNLHFYAVCTLASFIKYVLNQTIQTIVAKAQNAAFCLQSYPRPLQHRDGFGE